MRMTIENWRRFRTHHKKTTIRLHILGTGLSQERIVLGGPRFKPVRLGRLRVAWNGWNGGYRKVCHLTEVDAINDGFDTLTELIIELAQRNPELTAETGTYIHSAVVVEDLTREAA